MAEPRRSWSRSESELEFARIVAFTDGVIAIAITLLVLNIETPDVSGQELVVQLGNLWPALVSYAISFVVIGNFWVAHHRFFGILRGFDGRLMALNLTYLAFIVLIPFTTDVLDSYGDVPAAPILYAVVLAGASTMSWLMARHAVSAALVRPEGVEEVETRASPAGLMPAMIFVVSIPFAFVLGAWTPLLWAAALFVTGRRRGPESRESPPAPGA